MATMLPVGSTEKHSTVFFTFQFYKFPHITTERLLLGQPEQELTSDKSAQPCVLRRIAPDGTMKPGPAGYQVYPTNNARVLVLYPTNNARVLVLHGWSYPLWYFVLLYECIS